MASSSGWFDGVLIASHSQGETILPAMGVADVAAAMAGRHWQLPGCPKAKARLSDREKGVGGCDCGCGQKWGDWIGLAKAVKGFATMGEAARWVADIIGHKIPERKRGRPPGSKTNPARSLSPLPQDGSYPPAEELVEQWCKQKRGPSFEACLKIGCKVALHRCKDESIPVLAIPVWGESGPSAGPVNYRAVRLDGGLLPTASGPTKIKTVGGQPKGFSGPVDLMKQWCEGTLPPKYQIWWVEGESDLLALLAAGVPDNVLALTHNTGAHDAKLTEPLIALFKGRIVWVIRDADQPGQDGAAATCKRLAPVAIEVRNVTLPFAVEKTHGQDLRDYLNGGGTVAGLIERAAVAEPIVASEGGPPEVRVTLDYGLIADEVLSHLGRLGWSTPWIPEDKREQRKLYQRGGVMVHVVRHSKPRGHQKTNEEIAVPVGTPRIKALHKGQVPLRIADAVRLVKEVKTDQGTELVPVPPPAWLRDGVYTYGDYGQFLLPLAGIVETPILRSDGSLRQDAGYDEATALLYWPSEKYDAIPERPTLEDARKAIDELREVVADVPFLDRASDFAAWLSLVLTLVGRAAIAGSSPMFGVTANVKGTGKSLIVDAASMIAYGRKAARKTYVHDDDETRKVITSVALESLPSLLLDNVDGTLGNPSLDAALTATEWNDRILGSNLMTGELSLRTIFIATGNNLRYSADTARRVLPIRLKSPVERPEDREDVDKPDLLGWVSDNRARLAVAALTILRGYFAAGCPKQAGGTWGSYESWSSVIRGAIVWTGLADPMTTRETARSEDDGAMLLQGILAGLQEVDPGGSGVTAREIISKLDIPLSRKIADDGEIRILDPYPTLREIVGELCGGRPDSRQLGNRLRRHLRQISNGKELIGIPGHGGILRWSVRDVSASNGGSGGSGGSSPDQSNFSREKNTIPREEANHYLFSRNEDGPAVDPPDPPRAAADFTLRPPAFISRLLNAGCGIFIDASGDLAFDPADGRPSPAATLSADDRLTVADWLFSAPACPKCGSRQPSAPAGASGIYCGVCGTRLGDRRGDLQHRPQSIAN